MLAHGQPGFATSSVTVGSVCSTLDMTTASRVSHPSASVIRPGETMGLALFPLLTRSVHIDWPGRRGNLRTRALTLNVAIPGWVNRSGPVSTRRVSHPRELILRALPSDIRLRWHVREQLSPLTANAMHALIVELRWSR